VVGEMFPPEDIDRLWLWRKLLLRLGIIRVGDGGDTEREERAPVRSPRSFSCSNIDMLLGGMWKLDEVVLNRRRLDAAVSLNGFGDVPRDGGATEGTSMPSKFG
jgi:hypothetical protein